MVKNSNIDTIKAVLILLVLLTIAVFKIWGMTIASQISMKLQESSTKAVCFNLSQTEKNVFTFLVVSLWVGIVVNFIYGYNQ